MKRKYIFVPILTILVSGLLLSLLSIRPKAAPGDIGEPRSSYLLGSAVKAEGTIAVVSFFVDTPENKWNLQSIGEMKKPLKTALEYIENSARKYNAKVSFIYDWEKERALYHRTVIDRVPEESDSFENYLDGKIEGWLKYEPKYSELLEKYDADGVFAILWFKGEGRSYAICYDGIDNPDETLVAYSKESPCVLAHEILHLFGAHDYYEEAEYSPEAVGFLKSEYPNDIMLSVDRGSKIRKKISELTAYHLGWIDSVQATDEYPELIR